MATPFDRLMTTIRPHLPGAIDEAIRQELFMACLEFFKTSDAWREALDFTLAPGENTAEVYPFTGRINRLLAVLDDGRGIRGATMATPPVIVMPFPANTSVTYQAVVGLTVSDPLTRDAYPIVPYELVERYTEELMHGILSRMMAQPSKPYTNTALAQFYILKFKGGMSRAKNAANTGNAFGSQAWAFPQSFANR